MVGGGETVRLGPVNWIGLWTLYKREVWRFAKVWAQTIVGPLVTTLLFLAILGIVVGRGRAGVEGVDYLSFLAPGLIVMAIMQNAFANSSFSLLIAKMQGNITDFLAAPLTPAELVAGFALGAATRGLAVGLAVGLAMLPFVPLGMAGPGFVLFHAAAASLMLGLLGLLGGLWAQKMDQLGGVTNFVITPLTLLSGTFYSTAELPAPLAALAQINPIFYAIDGFRYGFIGHADGSLAAGVVVMAACNVALAAACHRAFAAGWRLRQ